MSNAGGTGRGGKVLVTGATGFIGGKLVSALLAAGRDVRAAVRDPERARGLRGAEIFRADLLQPESLTGIETGIDVAVHCASILGKWGTDEKHLYDINVNGTLNLLSRFCGTGVRRFVHLSAGGVTGPVAERAVDETYRCKPATAYERTKYLAERKVLETSREKGIPVTVLRPTFTYGPGDPHKVALFRAVKKGRYVFIGDGESVNHPVFVDDLIRGILLVIEKGRSGEVYIIGGERPVTKKELVYSIADALGVSRPRFRVPFWIAAATAPVLEALGRTFRFEPILTRSRVMMMADNFGYTIAKARDELGYAPATGLDEGIAATVRHYVESGKL